MASIIQIRRDTAAAWTSANPILADSELGTETDTRKLKIGDGTTAWTSLAYYTLGLAGYVIGSDVQAYDLDTSKVDVAETRSATINMADNELIRPVFTDYSETKAVMAANDVDLTLGNVQTKTITTDATLTFSNPPVSGSAGGFTLILTNGGSSVVTWPTSVDWPTATAPALTAAGTDIIVFTTIDGGTTWYGVASGIGMG